MIAWANWSGDVAGKLGRIKQPALVTNGNDDRMIPTANSFVLAQAPDATLIVIRIRATARCSSMRARMSRTSRNFCAARERVPFKEPMMKAIVYAKAGVPIDDPTSLHDAELPVPTPGPRDLLVRIDAIAVNPVDSKLRLGVQPSGPRVLGWDAAGTVEAVGSDVELFAPGDKVWYAGDITRPGSYAGGRRDERIASRRPMTLGAADAAAPPLTAITAWELLFDREDRRAWRRRAERAGDRAGGGVGSILVQLARAV